MESGYIDITVDGADEINKKKEMITGAGGAHVREKILAAAAKEVIILADSSKVVDKLGKMLPVEINQFGAKWSIQKIQDLCKEGELRQKGNDVFVTDNGNFLWDITFRKPPSDIRKLHFDLLSIPGVIDSGYFDISPKIIIANNAEITVL